MTFLAIISLFCCNDELAGLEHMYRLQAAIESRPGLSRIVSVS